MKAVANRRLASPWLLVFKLQPFCDFCKTSNRPLAWCSSALSSVSVFTATGLGDLVARVLCFSSKSGSRLDLADFVVDTGQM